MAKWEVPDDMFRKDSPSRSGKRLGMRMILISIWNKITKGAKNC